jgi:hypothetical protein
MEKVGEAEKLGMTRRKRDVEKDKAKERWNVAFAYAGVAGKQLHHQDIQETGCGGPVYNPLY